MIQKLLKGRNQSNVARKQGKNSKKKTKRSFSLKYLD